MTTLNKILSLIFNYERSTRVEEEGIGGSRSTRKTLADLETGSIQSSGGTYSAGYKDQIPDPWDDPLM